jgi:host factor-I protein
MRIPVFRSEAAATSEAPGARPSSLSLSNCLNCLPFRLPSLWCSTLPTGHAVHTTTKTQGKRLMATEKNPNIQDVFLNTLRKEKVPVTVFLTSGVKLQGNISGFDNFCVVLRRSPQVQLVYKHAIATIVPGQPISLYKGEDAEDAAEAPAQA